VSAATTGYDLVIGGRPVPPEGGRTVKFILIVLVVIVVAFLLFKYVLPGLRRR
jgi:hypothetical protein